MLRRANIISKIYLRRQKMKKRSIILAIVICVLFALNSKIEIFSACTNCRNHISVWEDTCSDDDCDYTKFWWEGHACCDAAWGSWANCPVTPILSTYEVYSLTASCGNPTIQSCAHTVGNSITGQCINTAYSKESYEDCSFGLYLYDVDNDLLSKCQ